jgi:hypothetical protein
VPERQGLLLLRKRETLFPTRVRVVKMSRLTLRSVGEGASRRIWKRGLALNHGVQLVEGFVAADDRFEMRVFLISASPGLG